MCGCEVNALMGRALDGDTTHAAFQGSGLKAGQRGSPNIPPQYQGSLLFLKQPGSAKHQGLHNAGAILHSPRRRQDNALWYV